MENIMRDGEWIGFEINGRRCVKPRDFKFKYWRWDFDIDERGLTIVWIGADACATVLSTGQPVLIGEKRFKSVEE